MLVKLREARCRGTGSIRAQVDVDDSTTGKRSIAGLKCIFNSVWVLQVHQPKNLNLSLIEFNVYHVCPSMNHLQCDISLHELLFHNLHRRTRATQFTLPFIVAISDKLTVLTRDAMTQIHLGQLLRRPYRASLYVNPTSPVPSWCLLR